ncbi:hypothetical protein AMECASPLE_030178 [Ameca splendens]|uniref:Uncharacterized protein n=1 Tax=Ameca splendens TaxID=208324 RepID=A0ABV0YTF7_9TELE
MLLFPTGPSSSLRGSAGSQQSSMLSSCMPLFMPEGLCGTFCLVSEDVVNVNTLRHFCLCVYKMAHTLQIQCRSKVFTPLTFYNHKTGCILLEFYATEQHRLVYDCKVERKGLMVLYLFKTENLKCNQPL